MAAHYNECLPRAAQRDRLDVVLVAPRNPLNIGAAARAMANFGFSRLTVVAPYAPHWREAKSAVGAPELLKNARCTETLAEALGACTLVLGTGTVTHRKAEQPVAPLPAVVPWVEEELARGGRVALVFGPEKHGLTREDLSLCHRLAVIPTGDAQPSMNLGQAVAVCLYELSCRAFAPLEDGGAPRALPAEKASAASAELDRLAELVGETMTAAGYAPGAMRRANRHDLNLLLRRLHLNAADTRRALGFFRRVLWRLTHPTDQS